MTDPNPPVTAKQAMPFDSLLAKSRDLVCERLAEALDGMLDKMDGTLSALIFETQDNDLRSLYLETRDKALGQRNAIAEQFRAHYLREFQVRSNRVKKIGQSFSDFDSSSLELDLVGEDDLNETLKLKDMATKLRQYCDEELVALDQRVGVLLGDANLEAEDNPFSPQAICDAFKHTCRNVDSNVKVRMVLLKLFDDHVLDDIRSVYKAVNALLVQNSILPKIRFRVSRGKEDSKAAPSGAPAGEEPRGTVAQVVDSVPGDGPNFFSVLQDLIASNVKAMTQPGAAGGTGVSAPGAAAMHGLPSIPGAPAQGLADTPGFPHIPGTPGIGGTGGAPLVVLQGAELMNLLTRVQHGDVTAVANDGAPLLAASSEPGTANVLRELKATSLGSGMNQLDSMTLDIVAMLFDQLFDDPKIPISVKGLIGRMQIPMLKVAIADKAFFSKKSHPARRLLDTLGEISSRLPADFNASNPLFGRLEGIIQDLMTDFQDNMEIFDVVGERLQTLVEEEDRRAEEETRSAARRIEQNESLAASKTMAEFEVKTRVQAGNLPRPIIEFLVHQWVKPLLIVHVRRGQHSDAWKNSLATMDLLIWSVEAKHTPEERHKLATVVPDLLKRLAAGLKIADIDDAIGERFFSALNELHTEAMNMGGEEEIAAAPDASGETGVPTLEVVSAGIPVPEAEKTQPIPVTATEVPDVFRIQLPDPKEIVQPIPVATSGAPDLSRTQLLDPKEAVQPTPAAVTELPEIPPIQLPEPKEAVQPTPEAATELPEIPPIQLPEPKETVQPSPAATTELPEPPPIHLPEPKETVQPIPAATSHAPAAPKIPVPAPSQAPKPMSPSPGHAPAGPKIPVPAPSQAPKPMSPSAGHAPAATKIPVPAPKQTPKPMSPTVAQAPAAKGTVPAPRQVVRPTPPTVAQAPAAKGAVPAPRQSVRPTPPTAAQVPAARGTTMQTPGPTARAIAPSAPRARTPVVAKETESDSLDFTKVLTIKNPFGGGNVNVKELESTDVHAAAAPRTKGAANEVEFINNLKEGIWVEFREKDTEVTHRPAKLSYISPLRSSFLFVDQLGKTVKECSRTELGRLVRLGMVVIVDVVPDEAPLFDRMMAGVIGKLS